MMIKNAMRGITNPKEGRELRQIFDELIIKIEDIKYLYDLDKEDAEEIISMLEDLKQYV